VTYLHIRKTVFHNQTESIPSTTINKPFKKQTQQQQKETKQKQKMAEEGFNKLWQGEVDVEVCMKHRKKDFLRVDGKDKKDIDWNGKRGGGQAKWKVTKDDDGFYQFQNTKTEKYLRIEPDGNGLDCKPKESDAPRAQWSVTPISKGYFLIETKDEHDGSKKCCGSMKGDQMPLRIYMAGESDKFSTPWDKGGKNKETVIIAHAGYANLKDKKDDVKSNGENGKPSQWKLLLEEDDCVRFKSKGDGFLRLKKGGDVDCNGNKDGGQTQFKMIKCFDSDDDFQHIVYLQSTNYETYIGIDEDGKVKKFDEPSKECRFALFTEDDEEAA